MLSVTVVSADKNQTAQNRKDKNRKFAMKEQSTHTHTKKTTTIKEPRRVSASLPLCLSIKVFPLKSLSITQE